MPTPQRLPIVNSDDGVWGDIIRQYLMKEHYDDGTDNAVNGGHQKITVRAGSATAGTAPIKLTSGTLMTTPEVGAIEFNGDAVYFTQTTGPTRKKFAIYDDTSGATGDIYYRNGSGLLTRLGAGSTGDYLTIASGIPSWTSTVVGKSLDNTNTVTLKDTSFTLQDATDTTKQVRLDVAAAQTTGTTRTITLPTVDGTLALTSDLTLKADASNATSGKVLINGLLQTHMENGAPMIMPHLVNDIAFNNIRGGSVIVKKNGTVVTQSDIDSAFTPDLVFANLGSNGVANSDIYTLEVTLCSPIQYTWTIGITMTDWCKAQNVMIETYDSVTTTWSGNINTSNETGNYGHTWVTSGGSNPITKIRYTLTNFANAGNARITQLYVAPFNSSLLTGPFLPRSGGAVYGASAAAPSFFASGGDANIDLKLKAKGSGGIQLIDGNDKLVFSTGSGVTSAVNYTSASNASTGNAPSFSVWGSDANVNMNLTTKGTGRVQAAGVNIPTISSADTLTNKTLTTPTITTPVINGLSTGTGVATTGSPNVLALRDTLGNLVANAYANGFTSTPTASGTTTISTGVQVFTGSAIQTAKLPTTSIVAGAQYTVINQSSGVITVQSSGLNTITTMAANTTAIFTAVVASPTTAANWSSSYVAASTGTVTATAGSLTSNAVVLGAGTTDTKVAAGITTDGTSKVTLGVAGTSVGSVSFNNATSGTINLAPTTGALGASNLVLPAASDTLVGRATADTLTNKTLSAPIVNLIKDANNKTSVSIDPIPSAVNYLALGNSAAGSNVYISAGGSDTNIGIDLSPLGNKPVTVWTTTGNTPTLSAAGADANLDLNLTPKGTGTTVKVSGVPIVTTTGVQTLTNKTLTSPKINQVLDSNGLALALFQTTASAVNYTTLTNAVQYDYPTLGVAGTDGVIGLKIATKGGGGVSVNGAAVLDTDLAQSVFNKSLQDATTAFFASADGTKKARFLIPSAQPTGTTNSFTLPLVDGTLATLAGTETLTNKTLTNPKTNTVYDTNGNKIIELAATASAVNSIGLYNTAAGSSPGVYAQGTDANLDVYVTPKGSGAVKVYVGTGQASAIIADGVDTNVDLELFAKGSGVVYSNGLPVVTTTSSQTLTNKTISGASNTLSNIALSSLSTTGTANSSTYLRGDGQWSTAGISWTEITATSQTATINSGYILNNAALVTLTLPTTAAVGVTIKVVGKGAGGWRIAQNASGKINFGNQSTTTGTGGRLDSTNRYDSVELVCITANTEWVVASSVGNIGIT